MEKLFLFSFPILFTSIIVSLLLVSCTPAKQEFVGTAEEAACIGGGYKGCRVALSNGTKIETWDNALLKGDRICRYSETAWAIEHYAICSDAESQ